ncbi:hypothetical protein CkaCkLH20_08998 [Colletotrichum karsti]|uniref:DUF7136 domain-containing protein n=1 Tax=Colletotrichum karsti TaxID=1095194 RepID=A0A9P6LEV1_9PEZI|nr:uncharacterized protein CkaCkLH20_08998 [Colletotrichum karsti]KAF9873539.1 hypothetical protein CkaCkLH20_08998 [Colletotrichum karsti]
MRLVPHAAGSLAHATAYLGAIVIAANTAPPGVLDFGLVFPRPNETYEPTDRFPIVFALQNAELAKHLYLNVWFRLINSTNRDWLYNTGNIDISAEWNLVHNPSEPFLYWQFLDIKSEGPIKLIWQPGWAQCHEGVDGVEFVNNNTLHIADFGVDFEIKRDGRKADLVAATSNNEQCPDRGYAIQVTNQTREVLPRPVWDGKNGTCAVLAFPSPTPTADPCRVRIDEAAVESMNAVELQRMCKGFINPPAECPKKDGAVQKSAIVAGAASFAAALGAFVFLLV